MLPSSFYREFLFVEWFFCVARMLGIPFGERREKQREGHERKIGLDAGIRSYRGRALASNFGPHISLACKCYSGHYRRSLMIRTPIGGLPERCELTYLMLAPSSPRFTVLTSVRRLYRFCIHENFVRRSVP